MTKDKEKFNVGQREENGTKKKESIDVANEDAARTKDGLASSKEMAHAAWRVSVVGHWCRMKVDLKK